MEIVDPPISKRKQKTEEQIALEKAALEKAVMEEKITDIRERVAYILNKSLKARNSDIELAWEYWTKFDSNIFKGTIPSQEIFSKLTKIPSLVRIRAKIQNEYKLFQANDEVQLYRGVLEEEKRVNVISEKPGRPAYDIYIDESGLKQDYLSIGGLWIVEPNILKDSISKIENWKNDNKISFEFHFKDLKKSGLEKYKEFIEKFISLNPTMGFKVLTIRNNGINDLNEAIVGLTFNLIHDGVMHEHNTGRAILPRSLHCVVDKSNDTNDAIKIQNIRERLSAQKIAGLYLTKYWNAVDSHKNIAIQAVDILVASVNRKINSVGQSTNEKDELADYVLNLIGFNLQESLKDENVVADNAKIFNYIN